jgi:DNA-binding transcriptional ArsR family regulator
LHADPSIPVETSASTISVMTAHGHALQYGDADLAAVGALLAEPARARVLLALADGRSLSASVLALEAGVASSTASHHLARLVEAGFVTVVPRGRHRYFALSGPRVGELIEAAARVAPRQPITSLRQGTRAHAVRYARRCYDHLAGRLGIAVTDALCEHDLLTASLSSGGEVGGFVVTVSGSAELAAFGVDASPGEAVRGCLDWTEQRHHIAGPLGRAVLTRMLELGWLTRDHGSRAVRLTDCGRRDLPERLGVELPAA